VLARPRHRFHVPVGTHRAHQQAGLQQAALPAGGVAHAACLLEVQRQRAFAEHMLARLESGKHDVTMTRTRQADIDGVDIGALDQRGNVGEGPLQMAATAAARAMSRENTPTTDTSGMVV
jgi:hypothetical protein